MYLILSEIGYNHNFSNAWDLSVISLISLAIFLLVCETDIVVQSKSTVLLKNFRLFNVPALILN